MGRTAIDISGQRFGQLTAIEPSGIDLGRRITWLCQCDCGRKTVIRGTYLRKGSTVNCGCDDRRIHIKHGKHQTPEYRTWDNMKQRCYNPNRAQFKYYGGRGITVHERWRDSFENFYEDMGPKPSQQHSIDRKEVDGNYGPDNCQWATKSEQQQNKRNSRKNRNK